MTTLLWVLAAWVLLSIPVALVVARMFRKGAAPPERGVPASRAARSRRGWGGRASSAAVGQDGARAATGSGSAH